jgi:hypothetical protein
MYTSSTSTLDELLGRAPLEPQQPLDDGAVLDQLPDEVRVEAEELRRRPRQQLEHTPGSRKVQQRQREAMADLNAELEECVNEPARLTFGRAKKIQRKAFMVFALSRRKGRLMVPVRRAFRGPQLRRAPRGRAPRVAGRGRSRANATRGSPSRSAGDDSEPEPPLRVGRFRALLGVLRHPLPPDWDRIERAARDTWEVA